MTDTSMVDNVGPTLVPKPLIECSAGELVRLDGGAWAIVANDPNVAKDHPKDRIVFLIGDKAPRASLFSGDSTDACLSYGTGFRVLPVDASFEGTHAYGRREAIQLIGKLIYSRPFESDGGTRRYFAATSSPTQVRFLDLDNFQVVGEPRGYRALFGDWEVSMSWPGHRDLIRLVGSSGK